jgi:hypothetical protein
MVRKIWGLFSSSGDQQEQPFAQIAWRFSQPDGVAATVKRTAASSKLSNRCRVDSLLFPCVDTIVEHHGRIDRTAVR